MAEKSAEYLAIIIGPYGGGSWARSKDKDEAAKRVKKIFKSDWKHILGTPKKGSKCPINLWDVTEHENVWWDDYGMHDKDTEETLDVSLREIVRETW